jgi:membrane-bound lytic murein transglycosylase D
MPKELSWLPLIESGFKPRAESGAKALGLWQFMPATGTQYGLVRNRWIDRRLDPEHSTEAAVVYLKYLYKRFGGDWNKALAAYNWGEGNLRKAIARIQKPEDQVSFWDLRSRLPEETRRYVPKFLAAVAIVRSPEELGFSELGRRRVPRRYETVRIEKQMDMDVVAGVLGIEPSALQELNPELRQRVTPPQEHSLRVPAGLGNVLLARLGDIPEYKPRPKISVPRDTRVAKRSRPRTLKSASTAKSAKIRRQRSTGATAKRRSAAAKKSQKPSSKSSKSRTQKKRGRIG